MRYFVSAHRARADERQSDARVGARIGRRVPRHRERAVSKAQEPGSLDVDVQPVELFFQIGEFEAAVL